MHRERIAEIWVQESPNSGKIGSGHLVGNGLVLTANHLVEDFPTLTEFGDGQPAGIIQLRMLGQADWIPAHVVWRRAEYDVALLLLEPLASLPETVSLVRWGRIEGSEPLAVTAAGFPQVQARPDGVRDVEQIVGSVSPLSMTKTGKFAVTVTSGKPVGVGSLPWGGLSGAALFSGIYLIGVLTDDQAGEFAHDRLVATPIAELLTSDPALRELLRATKNAIQTVGTATRKPGLSGPYISQTAYRGLLAERGAA